ncbi:MAG: HD domain-containing phosphohydrolase [Acidobacteriota bacterium]
MLRILLTGYTDVETLVEAINSGLVYMYVTKPWNNEDLKLRVNRTAEHYQNNKNRQALADANKRLALRLDEIKLSLVTVLSEMLKIRDEHASEHTQRVRNYALMIADKMGVSPEQTAELSIAALLHGLGRAGINSNGVEVGRSTAEQSIMQEHSQCEARLLESIPELAGAAEIIRGYRENFDGSGVPRGLGSDQIPLTSRIPRLADEYVQMISPKGSPAMTHEEAMRFLSQRSKKQFDPNVVEALLQLFLNHSKADKIHSTRPRCC